MSNYTVILFIDEDAEEIHNQAKFDRPRAVEKLIDLVAKDDDKINKFVVALSDAGKIIYLHYTI